MLPSNIFIPFILCAVLQLLILLFLVLIIPKIPSVINLASLLPTKFILLMESKRRNEFYLYSIQALPYLNLLLILHIIYGLLFLSSCTIFSRLIFTLILKKHNILFYVQQFSCFLLIFKFICKF